MAPNVVALLIAIAFAMQSFVTQTHIHGVSQGFEGPALVKTFSNVPAQGQAPADNNPVDCPYCQAIAHSGAFFAPAAPLLVPLVLRAERAALGVIVRALGRSPGRNWQSRAPPKP
jgi:hypothetical protein